MKNDIAKMRNSKEILYTLKTWKSKEGHLMEELWEEKKLIMEGSDLMIASSLLFNCYPLLCDTGGSVNGGKGCRGIHTPFPKTYKFSSFLEEMQYFNELPYLCLKTFYTNLLQSEAIIDAPVPQEAMFKFLNLQIMDDDSDAPKPLLNTAQFTKSQLFRYEIGFICEIINAWFNPRFRKQYPGSLSFEDHSSFLGEPSRETFYYRCEGLKTSPSILNGILITNLKSTGLLPLAWAEIWTAYQNDIRAGVCRYCGRVFYVPPNSQVKASCGDKKCKNEHNNQRNNTKYGGEGERKKRYEKEENGIGRPAAPQVTECIRLKKEGFSIQEIMDKLNEQLGSEKVKIWQINRWLQNHARTLKRQGYNIDYIAVDLMLTSEEEEKQLRKWLK